MVGTVVVSKKTDKESVVKDILLWSFVIIFSILSLYVIYSYEEQLSVFRLLVTVLCLSFILFVASNTRHGIKATSFITSAWKQIQQVTWPKKGEATHLSIVVVCSVTVISLLMWFVDSTLTVIFSHFLG